MCLVLGLYCWRVHGPSSHPLPPTRAPTSEGLEKQGLEVHAVVADPPSPPRSEAEGEAGAVAMSIPASPGFTGGAGEEGLASEAVMTLRDWMQRKELP